MKLDIKSFLIGVLTTVNLFLLIGFDDNNDETLKKFPIGKYQLAMEDDGVSYIIDTQYGYVYPYLGPISRVSFKKWNDEMVNENLRKNNFQEVPRFNAEIKKLMPGKW